MAAGGCPFCFLGLAACLPVQLPPWLRPWLRLAASSQPWNHTASLLPLPTPARASPVQISDMRERRGAHACSPGPGGLLYVVGGYGVIDDDALYKATGAPGRAPCRHLGCIYLLVALRAPGPVRLPQLCGMH